MAEPRRPNVLVVGRFYGDQFGQNIADTFEAMGHRVARFEAGVREKADSGVLQKRVDQARRRLHDLGSNFRLIRERYFGRLMELARASSAELVVSTHDFLMPTEVEQLREATGARVALWFPDAISNFGKTWFLDGPYDGLFFKDPYIVWKLNQKLDRPVFYLPECFSPTLHHAVELDDEDRRRFGCDITTAGNMHAYRAAFFEQLADYEVKIWGNPAPLWIRSRRAAAMVQNHYVVHEEKAKAFLAAKCVVNNMHPGEIWGLNARSFEAAGIGAFQLVDWVPGIPQLFEEGSEIVSFRSIQDLREKLERYLPQPEERRTIAEAGRARAHREHTYEQRLTLMLDTIFGEAEGFPVPEIEMRAV